MNNLKGFLVNTKDSYRHKWVDFPISDKEFQEVLNELDIEGDNYKFTDFYGLHEISNEKMELDEHSRVDDVNDVASMVDELENDDELSKVLAIMEIFECTLKEAYENKEEYDLYTDIIHSAYDLGYYLINEEGFLDVPESLKNYIDYEAFGKDILIDVEGGMTDYGFIQKL